MVESPDVGHRLICQAKMVAELYETIYTDLEVYAEKWREDSSTRSLKSVESSRAFLSIANEGENIDAALNACNISIALAPPRTHELCSAIVKRSELLSENKDYVACLLDINRALSMPECPEDSKVLLSCRKEDCLAFIAESNKTKSHMLAAYGACSSDEEDLMKNILQNVEIGENDTEPPPNHRLLQPPHLASQNEFIPNATAKIRIKYNSKFGRHIIAKENIMATEVLYFEDPFASLLHEKDSRNSCAHCFVRTYALIPCDECSLIMYCGTQCRDQAYKLYHRTECKVINILQNVAPLDFCDLLVLRITLLGLMGQDGKVDLMRIDSYPPNFLSPNKQQWQFVKKKLRNDYAQVCFLERDDAMETIPGSDVPRYVTRVANILYGLSYASFFDDMDPSPEVTAEQNFVTLHLLNNYYVIGRNPHCVYETILRSDEFCKKPVGVGLYPFSSFFNHSCDPNCETYFAKNRMICYANRPIQAGEQIFTNYGPRFHNYDGGLERRQLHLQRYGFKCECDACRMNWPALDDLPEVPNMIPNKNREVASTLLQTLEEKALGIKWCVTNLRVIDELLCFHRDFVTFLHCFCEKPSAWWVLSAVEIERLMEVRGNVYFEAGNGSITTAMEMLLSYVLKTDIRQWFSAFYNGKLSIHET